MHDAIVSSFYSEQSYPFEFLFSLKTCVLLQDKKCNVAFMPGHVCYTVECFTEHLCESIPATPSQAANGSVQISHIVRGGGHGDDVDEFRTKFGINKNNCKLH